MEKFLGRFSEQTYSLMRIVAGFLFACHGAQKVLGLLGGTDGEGGTAEIASKIGVAGLIELIGGLAIMFGFFSGWAAFLASGLMAVAYFTVHQPGGTLPIQNRGELAALYSFLFLFIAARGPGKWSVADLIGKK